MHRLMQSRWNRRIYDRAGSICLVHMHQRERVRCIVLHIVIGLVDRRDLSR